MVSLASLSVPVLVTVIGTGCGSVKSLFGEDERSISGIADYGKSSSTEPAASGDPELEAFWQSIVNLSRDLPAHQAGRLQVNLRDLRIRVDRPKAELVLICGRRLLDANDLKPFPEAGSEELALMLEQFAGDELMRQLRVFSIEPVQSFQGFLDNSTTIKPPDSLGEQLRRGQQAIDAVTVSPDIQPKGGNYSAPPLVILTSTTSGAVIHFTVDNSEPDEKSPVYTGLIRLAEDKDLSLSRRGALLLVF